MKQVKEFSRSDSEADLPAVNENIRLCPMCGYMTLKGMPGGRDAHCAHCGYKDPCCSE